MPCSVFPTCQNLFHVAPTAAGLAQKLILKGPSPSARSKDRRCATNTCRASAAPAARKVKVLWAARRHSKGTLAQTSGVNDSQPPFHLRTSDLASNYEPDESCSVSFPCGSSHHSRFPSFAHVHDYADDSVIITIPCTTDHADPYVCGLPGPFRNIENALLKMSSPGVVRANAFLPAQLNTTTTRQF
jgi:hypothetical protein